MREDAPVYAQTSATTQAESASNARAEALTLGTDLARGARAPETAAEGRERAPRPAPQSSLSVTIGSVMSTKL